MNKIAHFALALVFVFAGCDYVDDPNQVTNIVGPGNDSTSHRKVLIEEFTGHLCPSCPAGAQTLEASKAIYGDSMILVAVHMGYFAQLLPAISVPPTAPQGSFMEDFNTPEGNDYATVFQFGQSAPRCMYNRVGFLSQSYDLHPNDASTVIDTLLDKPMSADFTITHNYNETTRALTFAANGKFLISGGTSSDNYNIVIYVTEDSLLGWQANGSQVIQNYVFNHVFRGCVNTPGTIAGTTIHTGAVVAGDTIDYTLPAGYTLSNSINHNHADLVVFVYNTVTKEILQAEKVAIKE